LGAGELFVESDRLTIALRDPATVHLHPGHRPLPDSIRCHAYQVRFAGARPTPEVTGSRPKTYYENYYLGQDPVHWASGVPVYEQIRSRNLYPGIDLLMYGDEAGVEYSFIISPQSGDPSQIKMQYIGADSLYLRNGDLHVVTSVNEVTEQAPIAFQVVDGKRVPVPCRFVLSGQTVHFALPAGYDKTRELVIDPVLSFASFSGSSADNWGFTATNDDYGNLYGGGIVFGTGYPATTGAYSTTFTGHIDIGISKFSTDGSTLLYATYLGGSQTDVPHSMIVNSVGQLIVLGSTSSDDFPTTANAFQQSFGGGTGTSTSSSLSYINGSDITVSIFSLDGKQLTGSTYLGGTGNDGVYFQVFSSLVHMNYGDDVRGEVYVDDANNIYIGSVTSSSDFPVTPGAFMSAHGGGEYDGVIVKMSFDLSSVLFATYLGGSSDDAVFSLKTDKSGDIIAVGLTRSQNFPVTGSGLHSTYQGGTSDGFAVRLDATGSQLKAGTFLGTGDEDRAYFFDFDVQGDIIVTGQSLGGHYPVTPGAYAHTGSGQFIHGLDADLQNTLFSGIFGLGQGERELSPAAFMVDVCDRIYFSGWGGLVNNGPINNISGLPTTPNAIQSATTGSDFYFIVFQPQLAGIEYATYFGGGTSREHVDGGTSRFDRAGTIYQAVCAGCGGYSDFPTTPGAYSNTNNASNCNLGVIKLDFEPPLVVAKGLPDPAFSGCAPLTITFNNFSIGATTYYWDFGDGSPASKDVNPVHTFDQAGEYKVMLIANGGGGLCNVSDTIFIPISVIENDSTHTSTLSICTGSQILLEPSFGVPGASYLWNNGTTAYSQYIDAPGTYWVETTLSGCTYRDSFIVDENAIGGSSFANLHSCTGDTVTLAPTITADNATTTWNTGSTAPVLQVYQPGLYWVQSTISGCTRTDSFNVVIHTNTNVNSSASLCAGDTLVFGGAILTTDTTLTQNLTSAFGCDSTVTLQLSILPTYEITRVDTFCQMNGYTLPDGSFTDTAGTYRFALVTSAGCDSAITLHLATFDAQDQYLYFLEDTVQIELGYSALLHVLTNLPSFHIEAADGSFACDDCLQPVVTPYQSTMYFLAGNNRYACPVEDSVWVRVLRTREVYIPNAFSPNGDGINDFFTVFADKGVEQIDLLRIFDRWGNLIYESHALAPNREHLGWDGRFRGKPMQPGVFVYVAEVRFLNGERAVYAGDVTLIR